MLTEVTLLFPLTLNKHSQNVHVNVTRLTLSIGKIPEPGRGVLFFKKKLRPDSCILESEAKV